MFSAAWFAIGFAIGVALGVFVCRKFWRRVEAVAAKVESMIPRDVLTRARQMVLAASAFTDTGGEFKRRWVYAKLQKEFTTIRRRVLARAIEDAVDAEFPQ